MVIYRSSATLHRFRSLVILWIATLAMSTPATAQDYGAVDQSLLSGNAAFVLFARFGLPAQSFEVGIDGFLNDCVAQAESKGYVETMLGRRRAIPQIHASNRNERALGERMAINSVVQGSAADLIKLAMIDLHRILAGEVEVPEDAPWSAVADWGVKMVLQIHDELVFEMPRERSGAVRELVVRRMEGAMELRVPLVVDAAVSENWIDAK